MAIQEEIGIILKADFEAQGVKEGADKAAQAVDDASIAFKRATASSEEIERAIEDSGKAMKKTSQVFKSSSDKIGKSLDDTSKSAINFSRTMEGAQLAAVSFRQAIANMVVAIRGRTAGLIAVILAAAGAFTKLKRNITDANTEMVSFEGAMRQIESATSASSEQMDILRDLVTEIAIYTGEQSDEVASYLSRFVALGISQREAAEALIASLTLASVEGREARAVVEAILNTYRGSAEQAQQLGINVAGLTQEQLKLGAAVDKIQEVYGKELTISDDILENRIKQRRVQEQTIALQAELFKALKAVREKWALVGLGVSYVWYWASKLLNKVLDFRDEVARFPKVIIAVAKVAITHVRLVGAYIKQEFDKIMAFPDQIFNKIDLRFSQFMRELGYGMLENSNFMRMVETIDRIFRTDLVNAITDFAFHWDETVKRIEDTSGDAIDKVSDKFIKAKDAAKNSIKELKDLLKPLPDRKDPKKPTIKDFENLDELSDEDVRPTPPKEKKSAATERVPIPGNPLLQAAVAGIKESLTQIAAQTPRTTPASEIMSMEEGSLPQLKAKIENVELGEESAQTIAEAMLNAVAPGAGEALKLMLLDPAKLSTFIDNLGNGIAIMLQKLFRNAGPIATASRRLIFAIASGIARALPDWIIATFKVGIEDPIKALFGGLAYEWSVEMIAQVGIIVEAWGDAIQTHFGDILQRFAEWVKKIFTDPVEAAKDLGGGIWDGIKNAASYVSDAVTGLGDKIVSDVTTRRDEINSGVNNLDEKNETLGAIDKLESQPTDTSEGKTQFVERIAPITIGGVERTDQVLTAAEAFNPYVNEDAMQDKQPIEIQINLGTQRLIEFNTDITETGTTTVLTA